MYTSLTGPSQLASQPANGSTTYTANCVGNFLCPLHRRVAWGWWGVHLVVSWKLSTTEQDDGLLAARLKHKTMGSAELMTRLKRMDNGEIHPVGHVAPVVKAAAAVDDGLTDAERKAKQYQEEQDAFAQHDAKQAAARKAESTEHYEL